MNIDKPQGFLTPSFFNTFDDILNSVDFVDKVIFGRLNYNKNVTEYNGYQRFYNELSNKICLC